MDRFQFISSGAVASWRAWLPSPNTINGIAYNRNVSKSSIRVHCKELIAAGLLVEWMRGTCRVSGRKDMMFYDAIPERFSHND
jgi:hypothetical protein